MAVAGGPTSYADYQALAAASMQRPLVVLRKTLPLSIASGGAVLGWDIEDVDSHGWHSTSVNTGRITPTKAGWIRFTATIHWAGSATGRRATGIRMNASAIYYGAPVTPTSAGNVGSSVTKTLPANGSTDYFEVFAYQDTGGGLNAVDGVSTCFEAEWLRDL